MFCGECGAQNPDTNQFCRNCGKPLARRQPAAPAAAPNPVTYPPVQPAPSSPAPYQPPAAVAAPVAPKRRWNWLGILSIIPGILSLGILPVLLGLGAILLGIAGILLFRKATGRIGISGIIGIVLGITTIAITLLLS
jgi:hypothetical protein